MEDSETQTGSQNVHEPLLASDAALVSHLRHPDGKDFMGRHILSVHGEDSWLWQTRRSMQRFLTSKWGHYSVIMLVSLDIAGIFADFLISLHMCEHAGEKGFNYRRWEQIDDVLDGISLGFSCLFMLELLANAFAFGSHYFNSKFHIFDATIIVAGFIVDVLLHGTIEEAGSLIVVGRLWRVFKIIEEFSSGADDQIEELQERIESLEKENRVLRDGAVKLGNGGPSYGTTE